MNSPCGDGSIHLVDVSQLEATENLVQLYCFGRAAVLHGRYAIGQGASKSTGDRWSQVVRLHPEVAVRRFDPEILLGTSLPLRFLNWVEGPMPLAYLVLPGDGRTSVTAVDLETVQRLWRLEFPSELVGRPVADEEGTLYFAIQEPGGVPWLHALGPDGSERWRLEDSAPPVAAYAGTLVLESGEVVDPATGVHQYEAGVVDQVFLTDSALVTVTRRDESIEVTARARIGGDLLYGEHVFASGSILPVVTRDDAVILLERHYRSDLSSRYNPVVELRVHEAGPGGTVLRASDRFDPYLRLDVGVLFDDALVAVATRTSDHAYYPQSLVKIPLPGVRAPDRGWLQVAE